MVPEAKMKVGEHWRNRYNEVEIEVIQTLQLHLDGKLRNYYLAVNKSTKYHPQDLWTISDSDVYRWYKLVG